FEDGAEETVEEVVADNPCQNHHCKHGKVCELDESNTPMCVCQDPTSCPAPIGEFEKVCSNDNKTFDSSCHFFATKCTLEG
ncbi:Kazal-type serine protease inhibitor domain-containing protein, partial [Aeromicrobium sp. LTX1]